MRQRLGIARALINDPVVVFLDEPTLGLDPAGQAQVLNIIRSIAKARDATVVLSTHVLPEVEEVCSKVVILNHGRVVASGSVGEVIKTALIEQSAQLRVPLDLVERARNVLAGFPDLTIDQAAGQPDVLILAVDRPGTGVAPGEVMNEVLAAITAAGIPVLRFELDGARLSDDASGRTASRWHVGGCASWCRTPVRMACGRRARVPGLVDQRTRAGAALPLQRSAQRRNVLDVDQSSPELS
jgi:ABC-2 type transport system ATP-binding protein